LVNERSKIEMMFIYIWRIIKEVVGELFFTKASVPVNYITKGIKSLLELIRGSGSNFTTVSLPNYKSL
jgi:hypothetical protein